MKRASENRCNTKCHLCGKKFASVYYLDKHIERRHPVERPTIMYTDQAIEEAKQLLVSLDARVFSSLQDMSPRRREATDELRQSIKFRQSQELQLSQSTSSLSRRPGALGVASGRGMKVNVSPKRGGGASRSPDRVALKEAIKEAAAEEFQKYVKAGQHVQDITRTPEKERRDRSEGESPMLRDAPRRGAGDSRSSTEGVIDTRFNQLTKMFNDLSGKIEKLADNKSGLA